MDNFLRLTDERKRPEKRTSSANTFVDKERIERLKKIFLPSSIRWMEEQKQNYNETSSTKRPSRANTEPN